MLYIHMYTSTLDLLKKAEQYRITMSLPSSHNKAEKFEKMLISIKNKVFISASLKYM